MQTETASARFGFAGEHDARATVNGRAARVTQAPTLEYGGTHRARAFTPAFFRKGRVSARGQPRVYMRNENESRVYIRKRLNGFPL